MADNKWEEELELLLSLDAAGVSAAVKELFGNIDKAAAQDVESGGSARGYQQQAEQLRSSLRAVLSDKSLFTGFTDAMRKSVKDALNEVAKESIGSIRDYRAYARYEAVQDAMGRSGSASGDLDDYVRSATEERQAAAKASAALRESQEFLDASTEAHEQALRTAAAKVVNNNDYPVNNAHVDLLESKADQAAEIERIKRSGGYVPAEVVRSLEGQRTRAQVKSGVLGSTTGDDLSVQASNERELRRQRQARLLDQLSPEELQRYADQQYRIPAVLSNLQSRTVSLSGSKDSLSPQDARKMQQAADRAAQVAAIFEALQAATVDLTSTERALQGQLSKDITSEAQLIIERRKYAEALSAEVSRLDGRSAGPFQRALHWSRNAGHGGGGGGGGGGFGSAADEPSLFKYMGNHAIRGLSYALPGAGLYELTMSIQEAEKAQRAMTELQAEFQGLGQSSQFSGFSSSIKDISSSTGVAVSEVIQLGIAMKGVYGDTNQAAMATQAVAQATVTMGLSLKTAQEDLIGISQGFQDLAAQGPQAMTTIQNQALHLQDKTGVEAKGLIAGTADVASTANAAGFGSYQTMAMLAAAQQHSGLSSATIGETLSKIITSLASSSQLRLQTEAQLGLGPSLASQGMSTQIEAVMSGLSSMLKTGGESAQYAYVLSQLGINSSALPAANALFSNADQGQQLAKTAVPGDRAQEEFKKQMDTLQGRIQELRADFTNLGVAILNSGFGKALTEGADALGVFVQFLSKVNGYSEGVLGLIAGMGAGYGAIKLLTSAVSDMQAIFNNLKGATVAQTVAATEETAATETQAAAAGLSTLSKGGLLATAGLTAFLGTTDILNGHKAGASQGIADVLNFFGAGVTPKDKAVTPKASLTDSTKNFIDNFAKSHKDELVGMLGAAGAPAGSVFSNLLQTNGVLNDNDAAMRLYNSLRSGSSAAANYAKLYEFNQQHQAQMQAQQNFLQAYATNPAVRAYVAQQKFLATPYAGFLANQHTEDTDWSVAPQAYAAGLRTQGQTVGSLTAQVTTFRNSFNSSHSSDDWQNLVQAQSALNQQINSYAQQMQQVSSEVLSNGNPANAIKNANNALGTLRTAISTNDPSAIASAFGSYVSSVQQAWQQQAANATSGLGQIAALTQSQNIPADVLAALRAQGYSGPGAIQGFLSGSQKYQYLGQDVAAQSALSATQSRFGAADPMQQAIAAVHAANANLSNITATGDKNADDLANAQAQLATANQQLADATAAQTEAKAAMYAQIFSNAPLQAAQYTMQQLQAQLADAHSQAEYDQISGQIAQLNQQIAQDTIALGDALSSVTQANLSAKGNPIAAAFEKYQQDLRDIALRQQADAASGVNKSQDAQLQQMIAQSINDRTSYLQTQFSTIQTTTQEELYLGQITATQAISQLEAGMAQAKGNAQLVLQYEQAIRQIQNSADANLNFNIPSNLLLNPSLYSAERIGQGSGVYDQRQVSVNITIQNPSQNPGAINQIVQAIGGPAVGTIGSAALASGI